MEKETIDDDLDIDYIEERNICKYLGLKIDKSDYVLALYGGCYSDGGRIPTGWQVVCHLSKLKMFLCRKINHNL